MAKPPKSGYEVHGSTAHPLHDASDSFSRHFLEVYKHKENKTLLCPDCSVDATFKTWAHLHQHRMTCKGPFARIALDKGETCAEFIEIYRKLVAATPEKGQMVSVSVMLAQMQERLIKEVKSEHDRAIGKLNAEADSRHTESKTAITKQQDMIARLQKTIEQGFQDSEARDSTILVGVANVSAQVARVDTELTALKRAAVETLPLPCTSCDVLCDPEYCNQSVLIIEEIRYWQCTKCQEFQVDARVPSQTPAAELRVNGTVECWQVTP